jgi:replicative DNA helicase
MELVGSVIISPTNYFDIEWLLPRHFYDHKNQKIWGVIIDLFLKGVALEITTIANNLQRRNLLKEGLDIMYLTQVAGQGAIMNHITHAQYIYDLAKKRQVASLFMKQFNQSIEKHTDIKTIVDETVSSLTDTFSDLESGEMRPAKSIIGETRERILGLKYGDIQEDVLHTGLSSFTIPNGLIIIAARPSMGKSSLCIQICNNLAVDKKIPVALFELEMSSEQVMRWILSQRTGINNENLSSGKLSDGDVDRLEEEVKKIEDAPLYVDDTAGMNVIQLRSKAMKLKKTHDIKMIVIDYLQLMGGVDAKGKIRNRENEVSEISRQLKILNKELGIPVIAISQINRGVESRTDKEPKLSDLRESGALEQDADLVAFLYRPSYYDIVEFEDGSSTDDIAQLIVSKFRDGKLKTYDLKFTPSNVCFKTIGLGKI